MHTNIDRRLVRLEKARAARFGDDVVFKLFGLRVDELGPTERDELRTQIEEELQRRGKLAVNDE